MKILLMSLLLILGVSNVFAEEPSLEKGALCLTECQQNVVTKCKEARNIDHCVQENSLDISGCIQECESK